MNAGLDQLTNTVPPVELGKGARPALLVIDMQYHDASPDHGLNLAWNRIAPGSMDYYNERLRATTVPAIQRLLAVFRARELPVVYLVLGSPHRDLRDCPPRFRVWARNLERQAGIEDLWWSGNPDFRILEELAPQEGETIIRKTTNGAFNSSRIDETLQWMGIDTLVVTGVVTSACVETTARDAADRGYHCVLVDEATADYDEDMQAATLRAFQLNLGRVAGTAEDVETALDKGSAV
jgi:biuret amidohydrolase